MANLKVSENPLPFLPFTETVDPSNPVAGGQRLFVDTDHLLKMVDSSGTVTTFNTGATVTDATISTSDVTTNNASTTKHGWLKKLDNSATHFLDGQGNWSTPTGTGAVASDTIWDAAGDLAVGSGADTAARLAKGAAGANLSTYNGSVAWNGGTSFPASPATGDRYWRSDLGYEAYYDGTRWVTSTLFSLVVPPDDDGSAIDTPSTGFAATREWGWVANPWAGVYDIWVTRAAVAIFVTTTNDGSKNWSVGLFKRDSAQAATSLGSASTSADSPNVALAKTITVGASIANATYPYFSCGVTKTSTPGNCWVSVVIFYRLILT